MRTIMWHRDDILGMDDSQLRKQLIEIMDSAQCDYLVNGDDMEGFLQEDFLGIIGVGRGKWGYDFLLRHIDWKSLTEELLMDYSMEETSDGQQWWFRA